MADNRLRIHHTQEWYDLYQPWAVDDLHKFFERYLQGKANDWESTPRVRHSLLGFNRDSVVNRPETSYPPDYVQHRKFFLDAESASMNEQHKSINPSTATYQSDSWDDDGAHFTLTFDKYTELIGFSQAKLYMSCPDADDLDVYVICRKLDVQGNALLHLNIPMDALPEGTTAADVPNGNVYKYVGPNGRLRASHRKLGGDPTISKQQAEMLAPATAWHPHEQADKIPPGRIVCLDIPLWPSGMVFDKGESIRFEIKGHEPTLPEFPALYLTHRNLNRGKHFIHTGGDFPSSIALSLAS